MAFPTKKLVKKEIKEVHRIRKETKHLEQKNKALISHLKQTANILDQGGDHEDAHKLRTEIAYIEREVREEKRGERLDRLIDHTLKDILG